MKVAAVIFDAFGTLVEIRRRTNPYRALLLEGRKHGRSYGADDVRTLMTHPLSLAAAAEILGIHVSEQRLVELEAMLDEELESITPFADAAPAVSTLAEAGLKIGICSNLAAPYGPVIRRFFPGVDAFCFSYEVGEMKPDRYIYESACADLGVRPGHWFGDQGTAVMIGDSLKGDCYGPRAAGIKGLHLQRMQDSKLPDLVCFTQIILDHVGAHQKAGSA
ncbi:HAD family hydrolase [Pseudomonas benzopyrenica]|uniref:HAD family hydrolase n=1 Tax=Pseudomonas benzopyrenica TaxID=2993566 RepID=UPI0039C44DB8